MADDAAAEMLVACLHVPAFLVALARRDDPALEGRAVVIGGSPGEHAVVRACSEEAARAGIVEGMALRRALALCPEAVFLPFQEVHAAAEAARLVEFLERHTPLLEVIAPGHIHFDIRGLARMTGLGEADYLADLHEAASSVSGLPVHLGASSTVFAAHAATLIAGAGAQYISPAEAHRFLAGLPVETLPVPPAMHLRLRLFGLERLGDVAALPFSAVQAQFGRDGIRAWELANGKDDARITPGLAETVIHEETELPAPAATVEPLVAATRALLQRALAHRELAGRSLRRLDWRLELESGEQLSRRTVFREPTADAGRILFVLRGKIERLQLPAAAVGVRLSLSGLCSEYGHQGNLWPVGPRRQRELLDAIAQLDSREGGPQVFRVVEVQPWSRIPERQLALAAFGP